MCEVSGFEIVLNGQGKAKVTLAEKNAEGKYHTHWVWMSDVVMMRALPFADCKGKLVFEQDIILLDKEYWIVSFGDWKIPLRNNIVLPTAPTNHENICGVGYYLLSPKRKAAYVHLIDIPLRGQIVGNSFENANLIKMIDTNAAQS